VVERDQVLRIMRTISQRFGVRVRQRRHHLRSQQKANQNDKDASWKRGKQFFLVRSLNFSLPEAQPPPAANHES
jgi:hypothetical protein